jgi:hypothetical protein
MVIFDLLLGGVWQEQRGEGIRLAIVLAAAGPEDISGV